MIWYCASCVTCTTRCPHEVDIARVMEAARAIARRERVPAALPRVGIFYGAALVTLGFFGRLYELGLIMLLKLFTRDLTKDMKLGMRMLAKGKLKIVPPLSGMGRAWSILRAARMRERRAG
jgi:heterodisulfide reductase subunit C